MDVRLLIVGAGPAGLLAAWTAAQRHPGAVAVADRMPRAGAKLAVAGGGRGNLSHAAAEDEFAAAFGRQGRFALPAFRSLPPDRLRSLLAEIGVPTVLDSEGRFYPRSQKAADVRDALVRACLRAGVRFEFDRPIRELSPPAAPDAPWRADGLQARSVLLAAGGQSAPRLGSDGSGFALAAALGHDVVAPGPAMSPLLVADDWPGALSGVSVPDAVLSLHLPKRPPVAERGGILFTHRGLSGPAVLNLSGRIARALHDSLPAQLRLSFLDRDPDFDALRRSDGALPILAWLARRLPRSLAATLLDLSRIPPDQTFSRLSAAQERELRLRLLACPIALRRVGGFEESMATAGGVALKQVDPATLASRLRPRLHFAGEILDLDGPTGGWNLHWAFCSGHLAGLSAEP